MDQQKSRDTKVNSWNILANLHWGVEYIWKADAKPGWGPGPIQVSKNENYLQFVAGSVSAVQRTILWIYLGSVVLKSRGTPWKSSNRSIVHKCKIFEAMTKKFTVTKIMVITDKIIPQGFMGCIVYQHQRDKWQEIFDIRAQRFSVDVVGLFMYLFWFHLNCTSCIETPWRRDAHLYYSSAIYDLLFKRTASAPVMRPCSYHGTRCYFESLV